MVHSDTLYAFAQVAVAFAGFAGLMAFVRGRSAGRRLQTHRKPFVGMVRVALVAAAFAMLPVVTSSQGLPEVTSWRVSGALFAIAFAPLTILAWRRILELRRAGISARVPFLPQVATVGLLLLTASVIFSEYSPGLYIAGLFFVLLVSGGLFFTLVLTLLDERDQ